MVREIGLFFGIYAGAGAKRKRYRVTRYFESVAMK
jgi:hypothetical protein